MWLRLTCGSLNITCWWSPGVREIRHHTDKYGVNHDIILYKKWRTKFWNFNWRSWKRVQQRAKIISLLKLRRFFLLNDIVNCGVHNRATFLGVATFLVTGVIRGISRGDVYYWPRPYGVGIQYDLRGKIEGERGWRIMSSIIRSRADRNISQGSSNHIIIQYG